jgi:hypothetical protein
MTAHWGGPVKYIDISRATPRIVLTASERDAIISHLENRVSQKDLINLFKFLEIREIVDIDFDDII